VLLDVDGTLVDSNDAHARAWVTALQEAGHAVTFRRVRRLVGMGGDKLLPEALGHLLDAREAHAILSRRRELFLERELPSIQPWPGARALVLLLRRRGFACTVASSASPEEVRLLLERAELQDLLELPHPAEAGQPSKPDPDILREALERLGCPAEEALMIGDTPYDIEAGRKAGVAVVAFRTGGWPDVELRGAVALYDGPADLIAAFETSPLSPAVASSSR
jgi:HAD superfamily hydrolase (TIGR01509 family)